MPVYVYFRARLHWGFSVRVARASMGGPSLPLPPPSTLVGALAAGLLRLAGVHGEVFVGGPVRVRGRGRRPAGVAVYSAAYRVARHLLAAGAALSEGGLALWSDLSRYSTLPYQKKSNLRDASVWFGVAGFGWAVAPGSAVEAVLVFDDTLLGDLGVGLDELEAAAAAVHRLGSREGLVTVEEARAGRAEPVRGGETALYAPADSVESHDPRLALVRLAFWDPRDPAAYASAADPAQVRELEYAAALDAFPAPDVYLPAAGAGLKLRGDAEAYRGGWPARLGVVAGLG